VRPAGSAPLTTGLLSRPGVISPDTEVRLFPGNQSGPQGQIESPPTQKRPITVVNHVSRRALERMAVDIRDPIRKD
jgi:hypothetical protein